MTEVELGHMLDDHEKSTNCSVGLYGLYSPDHTQSTVTYRDILCTSATVYNYDNA